MRLEVDGRQTLYVAISRAACRSRLRFILLTIPLPPFLVFFVSGSGRKGLHSDSTWEPKACALRQGCQGAGVFAGPPGLQGLREAPRGLPPGRAARSQRCPHGRAPASHLPCWKPISQQEAEARRSPGQETTVHPGLLPIASVGEGSAKVRPPVLKGGQRAVRFSAEDRESFPSGAMAQLPPETPL